MNWTEWAGSWVLDTAKRVFNSPLLLFGLMGLFAVLKILSSRGRGSR